MLNRPLTLSDFAGQWRIGRRIDDYRDKRIGQFDGTATIARSASGMLYTEEGVLTLEGATPMRASRQYHWNSANGAIRVDFEDGRFFHSFEPATGKSDAVHLCGEDEYRVIYHFMNWPEWRAEWRVRGPRKDYRMRSDYSRA